MSAHVSATRVVCRRDVGRPRASLRGRDPSGDAKGQRLPLPKSFATSSMSMSSPSSSSSASPAPAANLSARISKFLKPASSDLPPRMYSRALALCREQDYNRAFAVFERVVCLNPQFAKAWVSWAQAEKRSDPKNAVVILQAGLALNRRAPPSARAPLAQAWGLAELQRGNNRAAVALLARAVEADPGRCSPVLRWAPVVEATREAERERSERRTTAMKSRAKGPPATTATTSSSPSSSSSGSAPSSSSA